MSKKYTADEVNYIRKLIEDYPLGETKEMFQKFRKKFTFWKDDTEAYTKFYQKKWRLQKEIDGLTQTKRKKNRKKRLLSEDGDDQLPPKKKIKCDTTSTDQSIPPPINSDNKFSFDISSLPKLYN